MFIVELFVVGLKLFCPSLECDLGHSLFAFFLSINPCFHQVTVLGFFFKFEFLYNDHKNVTKL